MELETDLRPTKITWCPNFSSSRSTFNSNNKFSICNRNNKRAWSEAWVAAQANAVFQTKFAVLAMLPHIWTTYTITPDPIRDPLKRPVSSNGYFTAQLPSSIAL